VDFVGQLLDELGGRGVLPQEGRVKLGDVLAKLGVGNRGELVAIGLAGRSEQDQR
jgi:hypothetical protein